MVLFCEVGCGDLGGDVFLLGECVDVFEYCLWFFSCG